MNTSNKKVKEQKDTRGKETIRKQHKLLEVETMDTSVWCNCTRVLFGRQKMVTIHSGVAVLLRSWFAQYSLCAHPRSTSPPGQRDPYGQTSENQQKSAAIEILFAAAKEPGSTMSVVKMSNQSSKLFAQGTCQSFDRALRKWLGPQSVRRMLELAHWFFGSPPARPSAHSHAPWFWLSALVWISHSKGEA